MAQPVLIEVADAPSISFRASPERQRGGELRWVNGAGMPTDPSTDRITGPLRAGFTFTGQRAGPANYVGSLMDYFARAYSPALGHNACPQPVKVGDAGPYNTLSGLVNAVCPRTTYSKLPWGLPQGRIAALS